MKRLSANRIDGAQVSLLADGASLESVMAGHRFVH